MVFDVGALSEGSISRANFLSVTAGLVTGLLFFFALSGEISEKRLMIIIMIIPFTMFSVVLVRLLGKKNALAKTLTIFRIGVMLLVISVIFIVIDNMSGGLYSKLLSQIPPLSSPFLANNQTTNENMSETQRTNSS
ncbi:MAG: hypothetical protein ACRD8W_09975 [Nitrososphaeraceae archaeon]